MTLLDPLLETTVLLRPDRFTPLQKTPWAGTAISTQYKHQLLPLLGQAAIGESWEFSCDPTFPSILADTGETLPDWIAHHPAKVLSPALAKTSPSCEILLKLLHAASPLSVQVHPEDQDPHLQADECGKPESWLVLHADPGAGLYLGFSHAMSKADLRHLLETKANLAPYLQFVPVQAGEYFEIAPGVCHAVGPGVLLLEPQRIAPGKTGKTYRLWDWNRTYDSQGHFSATGTPRSLHLEESLAIVDPAKQYGANFLRTVRKTATVHPLGEKGQYWHYPANAHYQLLRLQLPRRCTLQIEGGYGAGLMLGGSATITSRFGRTQLVEKGQPFLLPFHMLPAVCCGEEDPIDGSPSELILVLPASAHFQVV